MIGIATRRIVTFVTHAHFFGKFAIRNNKCEPVRPVLRMACPEIIVSTSIIGCPVPAFVNAAYINVAPKTIDCILIGVCDKLIHISNLLVDYWSIARLFPQRGRIYYCEL
jgi:hypothetical protein